MKHILALLIVSIVSVVAQEYTKPVEAVRVYMKCGANGCVGEMKYLGGVLNSYPAQYEHRCQQCNRSQNYFEPYPIIRYQDKPPPQEYRVIPFFQLNGTNPCTINLSNINVEVSK